MLTSELTYTADVSEIDDNTGTIHNNTCCHLMTGRSERWHKRFNSGHQREVSVLSNSVQTVFGSHINYFQVSFPGATARDADLSLLLLQSALEPLVGFGLLYDFVPQSSIFTRWPLTWTQNLRLKLRGVFPPLPCIFSRILLNETQVYKF